MKFPLDVPFCFPTELRFSMPYKNYSVPSIGNEDTRKFSLPTCMMSVYGANQAIGLITKMTCSNLTLKNVIGPWSQWTALVIASCLAIESEVTENYHYEWQILACFIETKHLVLCTDWLESESSNRMTLIFSAPTTRYVWRLHLSVDQLGRNH